MVMLGALKPPKGARKLLSTREAPRPSRPRPRAPAGACGAGIHVPGLWGEGRQADSELETALSRGPRAPVGLGAPRRTSPKKAYATAPPQHPVPGVSREGRRRCLAVGGARWVAAAGAATRSRWRQKGTAGKKGQ